MLARLSHAGLDKGGAVWPAQTWAGAQHLVCSAWGLVPKAKALLGGGGPQAQADMETTCLVVGPGPGSSGGSSGGAAVAQVGVPGGLPAATGDLLGALQDDAFHLLGAVARR